MRIPGKPLILVVVPFILFGAGIWLESFLLGQQPVPTTIRLLTLPPADMQLSTPLWDYRTDFTPEWVRVERPDGLCEYSWTGTLYMDPNVSGLKVMSGKTEPPTLNPGEWDSSSQTGSVYIPSREKLLFKNYYFASDHTQFFVTHLDWENPILEWESLAITPDSSPIQLCLAFDGVWASTKEISCDDWTASSLPTANVKEGTHTLYLRGTGTFSTIDKSKQKQLFVRNVKARLPASIKVRLPGEAPVPFIRYRPLDPVETLLAQTDSSAPPLQSSPWSEYDESLLFVRPMEIDGIVRTGIFMPTPSEWRVTCTLKHLSDLVFFPTVRDPANQVGWGKANLEVSLESSTESQVLWSGEVNPQVDQGFTAWRNGIRVPLNRPPGEQISLVFKSRAPAGTGGKTYPLLLGEPFLMPAAEPPSLPKPDNPKSVILISVDTLRADAVGCIAGEKTTPWMDQFFGEDGVVWTNTEAPSSWTLPSHASLMLSQYVSRHGVVMHYDSVPPGAVTLAEHFTSHQYETAAFVDREFLNYRFGFQQGFELFDQIGGHFQSSLPRCLEYLRHRDRSVPLFLFLHSYNCHDPYTPPEEYRKRFVREGLKPSVPDLDQAELQFLKLMRASQGEVRLTPEDAEFVHSLYLGEVAYVDDMLRDFIKQISQEGLVDDPLVILISDHGEGFAEHNTFLHAINLYEEAIRVPVMFRLPGQQHAGNRVSERNSLIDVPPTLFEILGWDIPEDWQGISLLSQMANRGLPPLSRRLYSELVKDNRTLFSLTQWSHKFINTIQDHIVGETVARSRKVEAYDLARDPGETGNLATAELLQATKELDQTGKELSRMQQMLHSQGDFDAADLDPATIRSLEAIGYLHDGRNLPKEAQPAATATLAPSR